MQQDANKLEGSGGANRARVVEFEEHLRALKRAPATILAYTDGAKAFLNWLDGRDLREVRREDIQLYQSQLTEEGRYRITSIHVKLRAVRRFYDYLERTGKVLINPTLGLPFPKREDRLPRTVLTKAEMKRLLDAPDTSTAIGIRDKTLLEVLYSTGLRLAEICSLSIHDVDVHGGFIRVHHGKGGKSRVVPLGYKACQYVKEYLKHVRGRLTKNHRDERALFVGKIGKKLNPTIFERLVKSYGKQAGLKKTVTPHVFRHTCATHMLADGADIVHVQRLLGHADIRTTQIYTRVAQREVKDTHRKTHPRESVRED